MKFVRHYLLFALLGCLLILSEPILAEYETVTPTKAATKPKNQRPVANAGLDRLAGLGQSVSLNGSQSYDSDGAVQVYRWRQIKGKRVKLVGANTATPTFITPTTLKNSKPVNLVFKLTVADSNKGRATDAVTINVSVQPCLAPQQLQDGICAIPDPAVTATTVQPILEGLNLANTRYSLESDDDAQPFSPNDPTTNLKIDTSAPRLVMLVNDVNQPILLARSHPGDSAVDMTVASTAEVFLLAKPYFFGVQIADTNALSSRIREHPLFASLVTALQTKINAGSPCPIMPKCNVEASEIADTMLETLDVNDLVTSSSNDLSGKSLPLATQNAKAGKVNATQLEQQQANDRVKLSLDDKGKMTVSNSYLTNYVLRGRGVNGDLGGWKLISPSPQRLNFDDIVKVKEWDGWLPKNFDAPSISYNYKDTDVDLTQFAVPSNDWRNTDLVLQGASLYDLVNQIQNGKLSWGRDGVFVASLLLMNTISFVDIGTEVIKVMPDEFKDKNRLIDVIQPIAKFFETPASLLGDSEEFISFTKVYNELLTLVAVQFDVKAGDGSYLGYLLKNSQNLNDILDQLLKATQGIVKIADLEKSDIKKEVTKNLIKQFEYDIKIDPGASSSVLIEQSAKFFKKYNDKEMAAIKFIEITSQMFVAYESHLKKQLQELKDKGASKISTNKKQRQISFFRAGRGLLTLGRYVFARSDKKLLDDIKNKPEIIVPALYEIGGAVLQEIATKNNIQSLIGKSIRLFGGSLDQSYKALKKGNAYLAALNAGKVAGNKLIPFLWDAVLEQNYILTSIENGKFSQLGPLQSKVYIYHKSGNDIVTHISYSNDQSQNLTLKVKPGDELKVNVELSRPLLFHEDRSPWLLNSSFSPNILYETSTNIPGRFINGTLVCAKKLFGDVTYSVHKLKASLGGDLSTIPGKCGAGTENGGDWYEDRDTTLITNSSYILSSVVYNSTENLPPYFKLPGFSDIAGHSIQVTDYFPVNNSDTTIRIDSEGYNAKKASHVITLDHNSPPPVANCTLPWGGSLQSGAATQAYQSASVAAGNSCVEQTRFCDNGVLSGSYSYSSCVVETPAASCALPWGGSLQSGATTQAYQSASVAFGSSCVEQSRVCENGVLSGSYSNRACVVEQPAPADVAISNLHVNPTTVFTGDPVNIEVTLSNNGGTASNSGDLTSAIAATVSGAGTSQACTTVSSINPSGSTQRSCQINAPATAGTYYVGVCFAGQCSDKTAINVQPSRQLSFSGQNFTDGVLLERASTQTLTWRVKNSGKNLSNVQLTLAQTADQLTVSAISPASIASWAANEEKTFTATVTTPAGIREGNHRQRWNFSDGQGALPYSGGNNAYLDFTFNTRNPDTLSGRFIVASDILLPGTPVAATIEMHNGEEPFKVDVNWGDGTTENFSNLNPQDGYMRKALSHTYNAEGHYVVDVLVTDFAEQTATYQATITVDGTIKTTEWGASARDTVTNQSNVNMPIQVNEKTSSGVTYGEYFASWNPPNGSSSTDFFVRYSLSIPPNLIKLDRKVRLIAITHASAIADYDRTFTLKTSGNREYSASIRDAANPEGGYVNERNIATGESVRYLSKALTDSIKNTANGRYEVELYGSSFITYRVNDGTTTKLYEYDANFATEYLTGLVITFKGNGFVRLVTLQYDRDGDGEYGQGETILLSTVDKTVDWSAFAEDSPVLDTCLTPWQSTLDDGASVTAYQAASVPQGGQCVSEARVCNNGVLSGSYAYAACAVDGVQPPIQGTGKLNDTGITTCSNVDTNGLPCPVADFPGQDAQYGRDVTHNDDSDGHAGFSFTKISSTGQPLPADAPEWDCVKDNVTGLMWEVKTDDGGLRDKDHSYTWYEPDNSKNGGNAGTQNGGDCVGASCDTHGYVQAVNAQGLCGAGDWRIPTPHELFGIASLDRFFPTPDLAYFPITQIGSGHGFRSFYWSASPCAGLVGFGGSKGFLPLCFSGWNDKETIEFLMLVRVGQ